jgi:2-iminobutanoate/2-iminopropanoate deaminase
MQIERIAYAPDANGRTPPYSKLVKTAAGLIFVAGQVGMDETGAPVAGGIEAETHRMFANLKAALAAAGLTLADVVKATVWLTSADDIAAFNSIYRGYFGADLPARACVQSGLMGPFNVEIDVIAAAR